MDKSNRAWLTDDAHHTLTITGKCQVMTFAFNLPELIETVSYDESLFCHLQIP